MNIVMLGAGAGGMYCGSCLRDNALAAAILRAGGHRVLLAPLYTPMRTDEASVSADEVFYGGLNVYLQQRSALFRHTPAALDRLLDKPALLRAVGKLAGTASPEMLGELAVSILAGRDGKQHKELDRLIEFLRRAPRPDVVMLPNAMFLGLAGPIRDGLGTKIVCELTGEDIFLDALGEPYHTRAMALIRAEVGAVDAFIATSRYYADAMTARLTIPAGKVHVVYPGISVEDLSPNEIPAAAAGTAAARPATVAYLARICPEKGLDHLLDAMVHLHDRLGRTEVRLRAAGYLAPHGPDRKWYEQVAARAAAELPGGAFEYLGEVDRPGKAALLRSAHVLCVPTPYAEPKGLYVLEGWACGLPFVGYDHGAFGELAAASGAAVLAPPGDTAALADALAELLADAERVAALGAAGRAAVLARFTADHMAAGVLEVLTKVVSP